MFFEIWRRDDEKEGIREKMIHQILKEDKVPYLIIAEFAFEIEGRTHLMRRRHPKQISLADFIASPNAVHLELSHILHGIQALHEVHLYLHPAKLICPDHPISVITNYTAERTIILSNKEGGIDFAYEVTNECELSTRVLTDTIGELFYYRDTNSPGGGSYPVYKDFARGLVVADENKAEYFEVCCYEVKAEGQLTMASIIHCTMREAEIPYLMTAEFGFELNDLYFIIKRHYPQYRRLTDALCDKVTLSMADIFTAVQQLFELFFKVGYQKQGLRRDHPLCLHTTTFDAHDVWLISNGTGGYDIKYNVTSRCSMLKLADDGVGVIVYAYRSLTAPVYGVFMTLAQLASEIGGDDNLFDMLFALDASDPEVFAENVSKIRTSVTLLAGATE